MRTFIFKMFICAAMVFISSEVNARSAPAPIRIGYINTYTGVPHFVERGNRAAEMFIQSVNENGGVKGRELELVIRDDRAQAADAIAIAEDLINREHVVALAGINFTHIALSISQIAERYKIPFFAGWCGSSKCPEAGGEYMFSIEEYAADSGEKLAELVKDEKAERWAVVGNPIEWSLEISGAFKKELKAARPDVVFVDDLMYGFGKAEGSQIVQALKAENVDGVFITLLGKELSSYLRAARTRGFYDKAVHMSAYLAPEEMEFLGEEAPAGWYTMGYPEEKLDIPELNDFIKKYQEKYDGQTPGITGLAAVINLQLLVETLKNSPSLDGQDLAKTAMNVTAQTPIGPISYDPETRRSDFTYWYGKIALDGERPYLDNTVK